MPTLQPIEDKAWFFRECRKDLRKFFPGQINMTMYLPTDNIEPEHLIKPLNIPVEFMLVALMNGAWLVNEDWQLYARYAIANRLRNRQAVIFSSAFDGLKEEFLEYQLNGGQFTTRTRIRNKASRIVHHPLSTTQDVASARLMLSTLDDIGANAVIQPFHWIRVSLALTDDAPAFGLALHNSEMKRQKITLCKMLRSMQRRPSVPVSSQQ